jgi:hypothetical protein
MSNLKRIVGAAILFIGTILAHALFFFALTACFGVIASPVGQNKQEVFSMYVIPLALIFVGWIQRRTIFLVNLAAGVVMWIAVWHLATIYDPSQALGTPAKEASWNSVFVAYAAILACTVIAASRNALLRWQGRSIPLRIPFKSYRVI